MRKLPIETPWGYEVRVGPNGWPGIFVFGDRALAEADVLEMIAEDLARRDDPVLKDFAIGLRARAAIFRLCQSVREEV